MKLYTSGDQKQHNDNGGKNEYVVFAGQEQMWHDMKESRDALNKRSGSGRAIGYKPGENKKKQERISTKLDDIEESQIRLAAKWRI